MKRLVLSFYVVPFNNTFSIESKSIECSTQEEYDAIIKENKNLLDSLTFIPPDFTSPEFIAKDLEFKKKYYSGLIEGMS